MQTFQPLMTETGYAPATNSDKPGAATFTALFHPMLAFALHSRASYMLRDGETRRHTKINDVALPEYPQPALPEPTFHESEIQHNKAMSMVQHLKHTSHQES